MAYNQDRSNNAATNFSNDPNQFGTTNTGAPGGARPSDPNAMTGGAGTGPNFHDQGPQHNWDAGRGGQNTGPAHNTTDVNAPGAGGNYGGAGRHVGFQQDPATGVPVSGPGNNMGQGGYTTGTGAGAGAGTTGVGGAGSTTWQNQNQGTTGTGVGPDRSEDFMNRNGQAGALHNPDFAGPQGGQGNTTNLNRPTGGPSTGDKIKGGLEKMAGRIAGNRNMVEGGEERQITGNTASGTNYRA